MNGKELMADLARRLNIEVPEGDSLSFEADDLAVTVNYIVEIDALVLVGDVGEPPPERLEGLYKAILSANHLFAGTGGATLALDGDSGRVTLCRTLPLALLDADSLYADVERFVNTAETWRKIVVDYRGAAETASSLGAEALDSPSFPGGGFMQV